MNKKRRLKLKYKILIVAILVIASTLAWSRYISTSGLEIREYKVASNNLPASFDGLKIVHFTDVHYGRTVHHQELQHLVDEINALKPDFIFFTGDLIDKDIKLTPAITEDVTSTLSKLTASIGKYAVMGNHDFKFKTFKDILMNSGFTDLDNNYDTIYSKTYETIYIAGLESELKGHPDINKITEPLKVTTGTDGNTVSNVPPYKILILHTPDTISKIKGYTFDLMLAGHSHNGQVRLPFIGVVYTPEGAKKYYNSYYDINGSQMYISGGIGTSNLNFRFLDKPSFNFYRLVRK